MISNKYIPEDKPADAAVRQIPRELHRRHDAGQPDRRLPPYGAAFRAVARALVEQLRTRNFILCDLGADCYAFVHRTFLEYFCAADIVHQFNVAKTLDIDGLINLFDIHCRDDDWREVLRLICGQIDEQFVGRIVEHLATRTDLKKWDGRTPLPELPLAVWCLAEARSSQKLGEQGSVLLNGVVKLMTDCQGAVPEEHSSAFGHGPLAKFLEDDLLPPIEALGQRWPGSIDFTSRATSLIGDVKGSGLLFWSRFVAAVCNNRAVIESLTECGRFLFRRGAIKELADNWADESTYRRLKTIARTDVNGYPRVEAIFCLANVWADARTRVFVAERCTIAKLNWVRRGAIDAMAVHWRDEKTRALIEERAIQDHDGDPRSAAIRALANKWPDEVTRKLLAEHAVLDENDEPRCTALLALAKNWPDEITRKLLAERFVHDVDERVRSEVLQALAANWPDGITRQLLAERSVHDAATQIRSEVLQTLVATWPDETTSELLAQRAIDQSLTDERRHEHRVALGGLHSEFGRIVLTKNLRGYAPYLDPLEPIPRDHIEQAAEQAGIRPADIDAQVVSLSAHLGWDITRGAKAS